MPICTVCGHEHEHYASADINAHGDVAKLKGGWVHASRMRTRAAPCKHTIVVGWRDGGRRGSTPIKESVVPAGWWAAKEAADRTRAEKPRRKMPEDTLRARRLGVKIGDVRSRARRDGITITEVLDAIAREQLAEADRRLREQRECARLTPAYVARVASPLIVGLGEEARISRALEVLHTINRLAKRTRGSAERIYAAKDRLVFALLHRGDGQVFSFSHPSRLGYCCDRGPIRSGENCWTCGSTVFGDDETWCIAQFEAAGRETYRWHIPPWKVTQALLLRAVPTEAHNPTQPEREAPEVGLELEAAIALVAHVGDLITQQPAAALAGGAESSGAQ